PCFHSTDQVSGEFCKTGPHEQPHDSFKIIIILHDEENSLFRIKHPACPDGENWRAADVERAGDVTASKREHRAYVHEGTGLVIDCFLECPGWKTGNTWKVSKHFGSLRVHSFHER